METLKNRMAGRGRKKPKILIVTWFHCLRNVKSAIGAWLLGYELELITKAQGFELMREMQFDHIYKSVRLWDTPAQLDKYMEESDADIIWCHNEPDLMAEFAVQPHIKRDRFVIHDCHDLPTLHRDDNGDKSMSAQFAPQERAACEGADAVFVPCQDYVGRIEAKYPKSKGKVFVQSSVPPSIFFPETDLPRVNGMLYCGQVNVPSMNSKLHYRNVVDLFQLLTTIGVPTHIYNTTPNADLTPYTLVGASVYGVMRMYAAIHQYTRYDYGFVGSSVDCEEIQICMPNKLFDCIAAGIPIISLNAGEAGKFVTDHKIGVAVQGLENMISVPWGDAKFWEECRANVRALRSEYTAEKDLARLFAQIGI